MLLKFLRKQSPARVIAGGFMLMIILGFILLMLPISVQDGVQIRCVDALYTSTSAVCVTGLIAVDVGDTFTVFGQCVIAALIQIGGLGVASVSAGLILITRQKMNLRERNLVREAMNLSSSKGIVTFLRNVFFITITIELVGALISFTVFVQDYPVWDAIGISLFHSIASFNNAGFDILGGFQSLTSYQNNVVLNLTTCVMIFLGGIGFLVIQDLLTCRFRWKKLSMHTKVVLSTSAVLLIAGTVLIKCTENITWLGALFAGFSTRTAGFSTFSFSEFSRAGLMVVMILMFIGASPGSTGGGIKTSTFFVLFKGIKSTSSNTADKAFHYALPPLAFRKAAVITIMAVFLIFASTYLLVLMEPHIAMHDAMFEMVSAYGTVGLSTGITPHLGIGAKILSMCMMFIGRLGPLTIATLGYFSRGERVSYPEGNIAVG